ncbi:MAG TPA: hypothetical protein PKE41_08900 [Candidatus Macondimonas sp.]|nr:hypothetical protein [Candidatus Macondimonas sp.]
MSWKAQARRLINRSLEPAGFTLRRFQPEMRFREMLSPQVRARQIEAFRAAMTESLANFPELAGQLPPAAEIRAFTEALPRCPVAQDAGGGGFSAAMLLWTIARAIEPALVVESGTFRGFTTWVLRQAAHQARQYAFDISFAERQCLEDGVSYHEHDWMDLPLDCAAQTPALIYFDDHVDQWRRIREAAARGFRYLVFDDSLPSTALHNDGSAAAPTVDMLFETDIADGEEIRWRTECGPFSYRYDAAQAAATRALIRHYVRLPDLRFIFGFSPANLVLIVLR